MPPPLLPLPLLSSHASEASLAGRPHPTLGWSAPAGMWAQSRTSSQTPSTRAARAARRAAKARPDAHPQARDRPPPREASRNLRAGAVVRATFGAVDTFSWQMPADSRCPAQRRDCGRSTASPPQPPPHPPPHTHTHAPHRTATLCLPSPCGRLASVGVQLNQPIRSLFIHSSGSRASCSRPFASTGSSSSSSRCRRRRTAPRRCRWGGGRTSAAPRPHLGRTSAAPRPHLGRTSAARRGGCRRRRGCSPFRKPLLAARLISADLGGPRPHLW